MALEGTKKQKIELAAKTALRAAIVAATLTHPEQSLAGRREASKIVEGVQQHQMVAPPVDLEEKPKDTI